jgi:hypothetical protein
MLNGQSFVRDFLDSRGELQASLQWLCGVAREDVA